MAQPQTYTEAVRNLQRYLRRLSFDDPRYLRVPVDGIFDTVTEDALKQFQSQNALPVTGRADRATWDRLFAAYRAVETKTDRTPSLNFFPTSPEGYELSLGERSLTVSLLQMLLAELAVIYDGFEEAETSGRFDAPTERNVRRFQRASLLPETGRVDLTTWNRILRDYENYGTYAQ